MKHATLERCIWVLLYGGGLVAMMGLWSLDLDARLGRALIGAGIVLALGGLAGIVWRARTDHKPPKDGMQ